MFGKTMRLAGGWTLKHGEPGTLDPQRLSQADCDVTDWLEAGVPGDVNASLIAAGMLERGFLRE